jgi:tetratricopeptide (TPR) repeat protein
MCRTIFYTASKLAWALCLTLTLCIPGSSAADAVDNKDAGEAKAHVKEGEAAAEKSDWEKAVTEFEAATKISQSNAIAYYDLGIAHFHLGNLEQAAEAEKRAISIDFHLIDAYVQLAAILTKAEDYSGAERILERAVKVSPSCEPAKASLNELCKLKRQNPELFKKKKTTGLSDADTDSPGDIANDALPGVSNSAQSDKQDQSASNLNKAEQPRIAPDLLEQPRQRGPQIETIDSTKVRHAS